MCSDCQKVLKPVVALDVDGTLAQWHNAFINFLGDWLGRPPVTKLGDFDGVMEFSDWLGLDKRTYHDAKLAFRAGGFKRWMKPYQGASYLANSIKDHGAELWITTTRPWMRLDNMDPDTKEWLQRNNVPYDHILYDDDKYAVLDSVVGDRLIAVVDDQKEQMERCYELALPFLLRRSKWNKGVLALGLEADDLYKIEEAIVERIKEYGTGLR